MTPNPLPSFAYGRIGRIPFFFTEPLRRTHMLLRFSVENWRSFKDRATLDMVAGSETRHADRLPELPSARRKVLPVAALYGSTASGKTKFVEALACLRNFIIAGNEFGGRFKLHPFRLDPESLRKPVRFELNALVGENVYRYELELLPEKIVREVLTLETPSGTFKLFTRNADGRVTFGKTYFAKERLPVLKLIATATAANQPFLTIAARLNGFEFDPFNEWIKNRLIVLGADGDSAVYPFPDPASPLGLRLVERLRHFGIGIERFETEALFAPLPPALDLPSVKVELRTTGGKLRCGDLILSMEGDDLVTEKLVAVHAGRDGKPVGFALSDESEGVVRLLDLLPLLLESEETEGLTVVADAPNRSLHTRVFEGLLRDFLATCTPKSRRQFVFTAYDVNLLSEDTFRRDELWAVAKRPSGESSLSAFADFKDVRRRRDIRKLYLEGAFGGVPPSV